MATPLTLGTAPLLLYLAIGSANLPLYVSETRNLYLYKLNLLPVEGGFRILYEGCAVSDFELRFNRGESVHLKLDIKGERPPAIYPIMQCPLIKNLAISRFVRRVLFRKMALGGKSGAFRACYTKSFPFIIVSVCPQSRSLCGQILVMDRAEGHV